MMVQYLLVERSNRGKSRCMNMWHFSAVETGSHRRSERGMLDGMLYLMFLVHSICSDKVDLPIGFVDCASCLHINKYVH